MPPVPSLSVKRRPLVIWGKEHIRKNSITWNLVPLFCSFDLERGPGVLGGDGIGLMVFISSGLFGFDQPGLAGVGPGMFFPALISAHLTWSIARPIVALLLRPAWGPTEVKVWAWGRPLWIVLSINSSAIDKQCRRWNQALNVQVTQACISATCPGSPAGTFRTGQ